MATALRNDAWRARRDKRIAWVLSILERETDAGTYGTITIHLEDGDITRAKTERSEMPDPRK